MRLCKKSRELEKHFEQLFKTFAHRLTLLRFWCIIKIRSFASLLYIQEVFAMNEIKKLDKKQMTQNVCSLLVKSGEPFESIALYLGISDRLIYYWQEGKRSPNLEHIYGISQLLGVSVESILN